jgi:hypothetical protein
VIICTHEMTVRAICWNKLKGDCDSGRAELIKGEEQFCQFL